ncbi:MAG: 50S ribosomal protein L22 [Pirellulaceae bacterium]
MSYRAVHKYARISARKVRPLADMVRGNCADEALEILRYQPARGARLLEAVLQSAVGSARDPDQNQGQSIGPEELVVVEAKIDGGPTFKRIRPMSRGQAFGILKRTAHITVELERISDL